MRRRSAALELTLLLTLVVAALWVGVAQPPAAGVSADGRVIPSSARSIDGKSRVEFGVKDEGPGIPPELVSGIFEPFFSTKGGKTDGLGLAVCLGIVQQHGGTIHVESQVGEGTRFRIALPSRQEGVRDNGYTHISGGR